MKIKNKYISRLNGPVKFLWIILPLLLGACQNDDNYSVRQDGPVLVKLSVSTSDTGMDLGNEGGIDMRIASIYILQFNAAGESYGTLRYVAEGQRQTGGTYTATLLQSMGAGDNYKLVILANLPDYGFLYGLYGKSYAEVQQACLSAAAAGPLAFDDTHPFPMFGVAEGGKSIQVTQNAVYTETKLVRAVARVDIGIGTKQTGPDGAITSWTNTGGGKQPFTMTEVQVWKAGKRYAYMPAEGNFRWETVTSGGVSSEEIVIDRPSGVDGGATATKTYDGAYIMNGTYCLGKIYLPESDLQWGSVYDVNHKNRLAIIVGGRYNGSSTETFYRVDFTDDQAGRKMDILRNHVYQFTIQRVGDAGCLTAEDAYNSKPVNLSFTMEDSPIAPWDDTTAPASPDAMQGYNMAYGGLNGIKTSSAAVGTLSPQSSTWHGRLPHNYAFDYNAFYGESVNVYAQLGGPSEYNGDLYPTADKAFEIEGVYRSLMITGDDVGVETPWKTGATELTGFDACRACREGGYDDWRLPRLSELALMYLNRTALEKQRGFTPFSQVTPYWSGSEYGTVNQSVKSGKAWVCNFAGGAQANIFTAVNKSAGQLIRCVRQVK